MGKLKEIFRGPHRNFAWFVVISTGIFLLLWIVGPGNTFGHWISASRQASGPQVEEIKLYKQKNLELDRQIKAMENIDTLEKFAREQNHFAAPGEDVDVIR